MPQNKIVFFALLNLFFANAQVEKDTLVTPLQEVLIEKKLKKMSNKNGNLLFDVANSNLSSTSNAIDLLSRLPAIQISSNRETISIIGKGSPIIYIDNQLVTVNDLNSLAVDDIKSIEIINNPSAKYEANGRIVLLISRKFSKKEGFKVEVSENMSFKRRFNNYLGINSSIKRNKWEFKGNFNYNFLNIWESNGINTEIITNDFNSTYLATAVTKRPQFIAGAGVFYKINDEDYFSFSCNNRFQKDVFNIDTNTLYNENDEQSDVVTVSQNDLKRNFFNSFLSYNKNLKPFNTILFTGLQYSTFNQNTASTIQNNFNNTQFENVQKQFLDFNVKVLSAKTALEKQFKNESKLEIGALFLDANATTNQAIVSQTNESLISEYNFREQNSSFYSQYSGKIKKISYSIGVRAETTIIKGKFLTEDSNLLDKNYTNLFPRIQIEMPIDSTRTLNLNYSKSIARPNYSTTSQGSTYINPYFIFESNINLDPAFTDEITLSFQKKSKSGKLSLYRITNPTYFSFTTDGTSNIVVFKPTNFDAERGISLEFTLPFEYKIWTSTAVVSSTISSISDKTAITLESKPWFYIYFDQNFQIDKQVSFGVNSWAITVRKEGVFERTALFINNLNVSVNFSKHWNLSLHWNDIFRNLNFKERLNINNLKTKANYFTDTNELAIGLRYSFGKIKNESYKPREINNNENRIR